MYKCLMMIFQFNARNANEVITKYQEYLTTAVLLLIASTVYTPVQVIEQVAILVALFTTVWTFATHAKTPVAEFSLACAHKIYELAEGV